MNLWAVTDKGIARKQNQDAYFIESDVQNGTAVFLVCDGMGGANAGNVASKLAVNAFSDSLKKGLKPGLSMQEMQKLAEVAVSKANSAIFDKGESSPEYYGMGTTLVAGIVSGENVLIVNVGDSRAYKITESGINQITVDHSVVEDLIRRGDIKREESRNHPNKNLITRVLGPGPVVISDMFVTELAVSDYILLCSDGLSNLVMDSEIMEHVLTSSTVEQACERLVKLSLVRGAPDNVTVVLFRK